MFRNIIIFVVLLSLAASSLACGRPGPAPAPGAVEPSASRTAPAGAANGLPSPQPSAAAVPSAGQVNSAPLPPNPPDLQSFPPSAPFTVQFPEPLDPQSAEPALVAYPWMDGEIVWSADYTALSFSPSPAFLPGQTYRLFLHPGLRTRDGKQPSAETSWTVHTQDAPRLVGRTPSPGQLSDRQPRVSLEFDRPMDPTSVHQALLIEPAAAFRLEWPAPERAELVLEDVLQPGTRYAFTLTTRAKDSQGVTLAQDERWDYWLPAWSARLSGPTFTKNFLPIRLSFSYPVDQDSVEQALTIDPPLAVNFDWKSRTELILETHQSLPTGRAYTFQFSDPVRDENGQPLPPLEPLTLQSPPPILTLRPAPGSQTVSPDARISILFDRPMDQAATAGAFTIDPPVEGELTWDENLLGFLPTTLLADYTTYTLTLTTAAAGEEGEPVLVEPFSWSFTTSMLSSTSAERASFGDYGPNAQVLDLEGRRALQFVASRRTSLVNFSLYQLSLEQFLERYSSGFKGAAGHEFSPISLEGTILAAEWTVDTTRPGQGWDQNIYETLVPASLPAGMYVLDMQINQRTQAQLILVLTRASLVVKEAHGELTVWTSRIGGGSLPGQEVQVFARDGSLVASGLSDAEGLFRTQIPVDPAPLLVIAGEGADRTVSGFTREWKGQAWFGWWFTPQPHPVDYRIHLYTERPIYQPGQTVFFKAVVREDADGVYSLPPQATPVTLRIRDARDNVVQTFDLLTNPQGSVHGEFVLSEGAMTGDYRLEAEVSGERFRQVFKVQEYRKPDFSVELSPNASHYVVGDEVVVALKAEYYFGEPVANAQITVHRFFLEPIYSYFWGEPADGQPEYSWFAYTPQSGGIRGQTDDNGLFTFRIPAELYESYLPDYEYNSRRETVWAIEATLDDGSRQTVSGVAMVRVLSANHQLTLEAGDYLKKPGQPFAVQAEVVDLEERPVDGSALTLELRRWNATTWRYDSVVQSTRLETGPDGRASLSYTVPRSGYYQLRLSGADDRGNLLAASTWIYVYHTGETFFFGQDTFRMSADQPSYRPGDTANLVIESQVSGQALLTFERGQVHREQIITLTPPLTLVPVQIQESDAPNIFASIHVWEMQDTSDLTNIYTSLADARLRSTSLELSVEVTGRRLEVSILPERQVYAPGETARVTLRVTDEAGRPVEAEVSLAVVDEALYALSEDLARPIFDAFYARRPNRVNTYNSMALIRSLFLGGMGGGGGEAASALPRTHFQDTAAWFPALSTGPDGEVTVSVALPDNLTSWRLTGRAVSAATQVGEATANIVTHQEIIVRPFLPFSVTVGDTLTLSGAVHNYAAEPRQVEVTLTTSSLGDERLRLLEPSTHSITLSPGEVRMLTWQAEAMSSGEVFLTLAAAGPGGQVLDSARLVLPVRQVSTADIFSQVGTFAGEFYAPIFVQDGILPTSRVEVEVSRSVAGAVLEGLEYLTGYPYGCVEQTMSRALPNAVVGRLYHRLGIENPTLTADLPPLIRAGLQRLYGYQHTDGGWGWWYDDRTDAYQTAWVVFGLAVTAEAGYEVDPQVIQRGSAWLSANLGQMDPRLQAYALYSLAAAGYGDRAATLARAETAYTLDTFSQSVLALALHRLEEHAAARAVLELVVRSAQRTPAGLVYWPQPGGDQDYHLRTMASTTRTSASALNALAAIDPQNELVPLAAAWLMGQRRTHGWGHTNETSYAILALSDYLLSTAPTQGDSLVRVELNGQLIESLHLAGHPAGAGSTAILSLAPDQLVSGGNLLHFTVDGPERLYVAVRSRMDIASTDLPAAGELELERQYLDFITKAPLESFTPGSLVRVQLTVTAGQPVYFAILEDQLPAGLEALNENLNTTSRVVDYDRDIFRYEGLGYNNKEVRGDRVTFFISEIRPGVKRIEYLARAVTPGIFTALPAEAYAMYDPATWGRSATAVVVVGPVEQE